MSNKYSTDRLLDPRNAKPNERYKPTKPVLLPPDISMASIRLIVNTLKGLEK